jgi:molybdate transport system regulatory protein
MNTDPGICLSIRIDLPNGGRIGPGKASLLQALSNLGSLKKAAAQLGMSYPRALKLVDEMNHDFEAPLVSATQGGAEGGGSRLTELGRDVLRLYLEICHVAGSETRSTLHELTLRSRRK